MSTIYKHSYTQPASTCFGYLQVVHNYKLLQQQFVYIVIHNWIDARFHYITEIIIHHIKSAMKWCKPPRLVFLFVWLFVLSSSKLIWMNQLNADTVTDLGRALHGKSFQKLIWFIWLTDQSWWCAGYKIWRTSGKVSEGNFHLVCNCLQWYQLHHTLVTGHPRW